MAMSDVERIRAALSFVCPDDRDTWVAMGMAVKDELGAAGFDIWDAWSQQSASYQPAAAKSVWKSFKASGKVSVGSLFHAARLAGWQDDDRYAIPDPLEVERRRAVRAAAEAAETRKREQLAERAGHRAGALWSSASRTGVSPYLVHKRVEAESIRFLSDGAVVVPLVRYGVPPSLVGAQVILADGAKRFVTGSAKQGSACRLGMVVEGQPIMVAEGLATGLTIRQATGRRWPVFVAFDAGNLLPVALMLRRLFPRCPLLICADDDFMTAGNPGIAKAKKVVKQVPYAHLIYPVFSGPRSARTTDFNDLHVAEGIDAVSRQFAAPLAYLGGLKVRSMEVQHAA